jgi:methylthioribose-1-phosphate isomerase
MGVLEAIRYTNEGLPRLEILDQLQLPHTSHYDAILTAEDGWQAIRHMRTRGAPAIAIVAALSLAVELGASKIGGGTAAEARDFIHGRLAYLVTSRPTAVNLEDAARKLGVVVDEAAALEGADRASVAGAYILAAQAMLRKDVQDNEAIGRYGAQWIAKNAGHASARKFNVITHCNTG